METRIYKDKSGWIAKTQVSLANRRILDIRTAKTVTGTGRLSTRATVSTLDDSGYTTHVMGFGTGGGDFNMQVADAAPARITEKVVREQHARALADLQTIRVRVDLHYEQQAAALASAATETVPLPSVAGSTPC